MTSPVAARPGPRTAVEPLFVFGSNLRGEHTEGHAAVATR